MSKDSKEVKGTPGKDEKPTFDTIKWDSKDEMVSLFPTYIQEQLAMARQKTVSKTVDLFINLKKPLSNEYLLKDAQLLIEPNKRICLVGDPSCGKTTLFHALAHGEIKDFPKHLHVHHCEELGVTPEPVSILDAVVKAHEYRNCLLRCREELEKRINADEKPDDEVLEGLHANLDFVKFNLNKIRSDDAEERATKMLRVLGFDDMKKSTNALSGGLRMRVALCAAFFIEADLLLLDEPTNHLDFPSVLWLENRLRAYRSSFMLISHDRELLENVCTSLIRFDEKKLTYHNVGFAQFEKMKAAADKKKDAEIDKFMQANRNVDPSSQKAKEKADKAAWQAAYQNKLIQLAGKFTFPDSVPLKPQPDDPADPLDISLIKLTDVRFSYDPAKGLPFIFDKPISINITCRTRMGIMGPNGAGKSTLLKLLTKRLVPTEGKRTEHPTATVAYFAQHHAAELNMEMTAMEYMISQFPEVKNNGLLRKHLEKVGIAGPLADTRMKSITAGQRSCVIFAKITYICPHLLIMDEPTNFLDLESVDSLISATNKYKGALLLVSHNRGFLKKCATHYLSVVPGKFEIYDDMKTCERATYSFIAELEEEGGAGKIGASALQKLPKHGSAAAGEKKEDGAAGEEKKEGDGAKVFSFSGSGKPTKVVKKVVVVKKEGAKAEAGAAAPKAGAAAPKAGAAAPKAGAKAEAGKPAPKQAAKAAAPKAGAKKQG